jgi:hypothetical protein
VPGMPPAIDLKPIRKRQRTSHHTPPVSHSPAGLLHRPVDPKRRVDPWDVATDLGTAVSRRGG